MFRTSNPRHCCPRKRPAGRTPRWPRLLLPIVGLLSLLWFLIRVIPKPSRAAYPCQRLALPFASSFVVWLVGALGSAATFKRALTALVRKRPLVAALFLASGVAILYAALLSNAPAVSSAQPVQPNAPLGRGRGVHPGRVVWVHDPDATNWQGPGHGHWWQPQHTDQQRVEKMLSLALRRLTATQTDKQAWDKLFAYLNAARGKGPHGYKPGEKIAIKVNFVGFIWRHGGVNPDNYNLESWRDYMNSSPQLILALFRQLTEVVGVRQSDISLCDSLAYFANEYYNILHSRYSDVRYMDYTGKFGRIKMQPSSIPLYWSCRPSRCKQDYVPRAFAQADYIINLANLKAHTGAGVTLCAKNHYGSLIRWPVQKGYYNLHANAFAPGYGKYRPLVDLMGHAHIGGKTVLYLIDGLYSGIHPIDRAPRRWRSSPFNGDWTSSLFASQDPVAIDSVGFDFLRAEYDNYPRKSGVDDYLHEAALADNPPSGTFYDPDHPKSVKRLASLGVHEHWNNPEQKKYSRNLGKSQGIELLTVRPRAASAAGIIAPGAKLVKLAGGFKFTEGPAADRYGNVFFTDQPNNRIYKWSIDGRLTVFHESPGRANGLYFDKDGNLLACADLNNELWLIDRDGKVTVLVKDYRGKKLNGPNDLWAHPNGGIYFTDPYYRRPYWTRGPMEQDGQHVYYLSPDRKKLIRVTDDLVQPNGIIGTPDGKFLYVADIGDGKTYRYTINPDGTLSGKTLFAPMGSDGMTIDEQGNVYLTGKGVTVFDSQGRKIEHIDVPSRWTANVCFGGPQRDTLFITATDSLYAIKMNVKGVP